MLKILNEIPEGFLEATPRDLHEILPGPTLIHLKGKREPELFVSILQHGNEPVGLFAIQEILKKTTLGGGDCELPRAMTIFVSNPEAAAKGLRFVEGQPDFNRIWPGGDGEQTPEHAIMARVTDIMRARSPMASVDIHSTTGLNPHYACVNHLDAKSLHLASFFSRTVVFFRLPKGVQSISFCEFCPAVTLECGKVGDTSGVEHATNYLWGLLKMRDFPTHDVAAGDVNLYRTVGRVTVKDGATIGFDGSPCDITFVEDLDHFNFTELPEGTVLGRVAHENGPILQVQNEDGQDITRDYFVIEDHEIKTRAAVMPSMLTRDRAIIRKDCLCYVMERFPFALEHPEG